MKQFNACSLALNQLSLTEDLGRQSWLHQGLPWDPVFSLSLFFCRQVGSHLLQELASVSEPGTMAKSQAPGWLPYPSSGCAYLSLFPLNKPPCRRPVLDTITEVSPSASTGTSKGFGEKRAALHVTRQWVGPKSNALLFSSPGSFCQSTGTWRSVALAPITGVVFTSYVFFLWFNNLSIGVQLNAWNVARSLSLP